MLTATESSQNVYGQKNDFALAWNSIIVYFHLQRTFKKKKHIYNMLEVNTPLAVWKNNNFTNQTPVNVVPLWNCW